MGSSQSSRHRTIKRSLLQPRLLKKSHSRDLFLEPCFFPLLPVSPNVIKHFIWTLLVPGALWQILLSNLEFGSSLTTDRCLAWIRPVISTQHLHVGKSVFKFPLHFLQRKRPRLKFTFQEKSFSVGRRDASDLSAKSFSMHTIHGKIASWVPIMFVCWSRLRFCLRIFCGWTHL